MRTTLNIDRHLLDSAKAIAMQRKCAVGTVMEDALRGFVTQVSRAKPAARRRGLPESGRGGLLPGVDIDRTADLLAVMESDHAADGRKHPGPRLSHRHA